MSLRRRYRATQLFQEQKPIQQRGSSEKEPAKKNRLRCPKLTLQEAGKMQGAV